jgi:(E)-4-hydroxy-3-methylbut-2-enyl-diphosphate synthase
MITKRNKTSIIKIGKVKIGGKYPVAVQSMTKTATTDVRATVAQIKRLEKLGCEIIRVAVPDMESALKLGAIKKQISIPLVADIHFQWQLALAAIDQGVDKIRINPGNIEKEKLTLVLDRAAARNIPIRIGVNSGSLKHGSAGRSKAEQMVASLMEYIRFFERARFRNIVVSLKATDVPQTIQAYRLAAAKVDYPLHLGITEAGTGDSGLIKSSVGIGALLADGIGDTIRVSLSAEPEVEVKAAYAILQSLGLRQYYPEVISCPTCARARINIVKLAEQVNRLIMAPSRGQWDLPLKIAVMGCAVNGPGEAREADFGVAGGRGEGLFFRNGKVVGKVKEKDLLRVLKKEIAKHHGCKP